MFLLILWYLIVASFYYGKSKATLTRNTHIITSRTIKIDLVFLPLESFLYVHWNMHKARALLSVSCLLYHPYHQVSLVGFRQLQVNLQRSV